MDTNTLSIIALFFVVGFFVGGQFVIIVVNAELDKLDNGV